MTRRDLAFTFAALLSMGLFFGCGGNVTVSTGGGGAGGGTAGNGGGTITTGTGGTTVTTGTTGTTITTGSGGAACDGLGHVACLSAYPSCVPVYDDKCCPTCNPGACADCINYDFDHCQAKSSACDGQKPSCGMVPDWACAGGQASCNIDPGGSTEPCHTVPGCIAAWCSLDGPPCAGPICHPATKDTCSINCDSKPPTCDPGKMPEGDGFCYTGLCIEENLCVIGL